VVHEPLTIRPGLLDVEKVLEQAMVRVTMFSALFASLR